MSLMAALMFFIRIVFSILYKIIELPMNDGQEQVFTASGLWACVTALGSSILYQDECLLRA